MQVGDLWRLAKSRAALTIADQGIVSAANFAATIIVGRFCSKEELGIYALGFTLVLLAQNTQQSLVTSAYMVFSPKMDREERHAYTGSMVMHHALIAGICLVAFSCAAIILQPTGNAALAPLLWTLAIASGAILLKELARQMSFAALRIHIAFLLDSIFAVTQVSGMLLLALAGVLSGSNAYWVLGLAGLISGLTWLIARGKTFQVEKHRIASDFQRNWLFSRWIFATNLAFIASNQLYPWLLLTFHGTTANGEFGACYTIVMLTNPFILGVGNFLAPRSVHALTDEGVPAMDRVVRMASLFFLVLMGSFALSMLLMGDWVLYLLFGPKYLGLSATVALLAASQLAFSLNIPLNHGLNALERPEVAFKALLCSLVVTATLGVWLVWRFGPPGVALGLLCGNSAALIFTQSVYRMTLRRIRREEGDAHSE